MKRLSLLLILLVSTLVFAFEDSLHIAPVLPKATIDTTSIFVTEADSVNNQVKVSMFDRTMDNLGIKKIKSNSTPKAKDAFRLSFGKILTSIILLLIVGVVIKFISNILNTVSEKKDNWRLIIKRIIPIFRIGSWTFAIYFVVQIVIAPPVETLFAVVTSAGVAVGFASQDILKNIFSGIMILFDRPFQVGDKIEVGGYYGEVISIGLRSIRIVTPDDSVVSVPNSEVTNKMVSNANFGENNCQVVSDIYLPVDTDLEQAYEIGYKAAAVSRYVYLKKPIGVVFSNKMFEDKSMIHMKVKAYVYDIRAEYKLKSDITKTTIRELRKRGIVTEV